MVGRQRLEAHGTSMTREKRAEERDLLAGRSMARPEKAKSQDGCKDGISAHPDPERKDPVGDVHVRHAPPFRRHRSSRIPLRSVLMKDHPAVAADKMFKTQLTRLTMSPPQNAARNPRSRGPGRACATSRSISALITSVKSPGSGW